jgi:hypothetical protein
MTKMERPRACVAALHAIPLALCLPALTLNDAAAQTAAAPPGLNIVDATGKRAGT